MDKTWIDTYIKCGELDKAIDLVYIECGSLIYYKHLDKLNKIFLENDPNSLHLEISLALLTATLPVKSQLSARPKFYKSTLALSTEEMLKGLK